MIENRVKLGVLRARNTHAPVVPVAAAPCTARFGLGIAAGGGLCTFLAVTIGEWVGSSRGLGYLMLMANGRDQTDLMFAALAVLAAQSLALFALIEALSRKGQA